MTEYKNMLALRAWMLALVLVALAVVISYYGLDRPIALFIHDQLPRSSRLLIEPVTYIPNPLILVATITFLALGIRSLAGHGHCRKCKLPDALIINLKKIPILDSKTDADRQLFDGR